MKAWREDWQWCDDCDCYHGPGGCDPSEAALRESAQKDRETLMKLIAGKQGEKK
jgi:hypothetical protein